MVLPRFRIRFLLIVTAVVALWLSTFTGYTGSNDVQAFIWAAIVIMSGVAAVSCTARRRAFWAGFCSTMLLTTTRTVFTLFGARLSWTQNLSRGLAEKWQGDIGGRGQVVLNINATLILVTIVVAAILIGILCIFVYDQSKIIEKSDGT